MIPPCEALLVALALAVLIPIAVLSSEVILAATGSHIKPKQRISSERALETSGCGERARAAVIVPARDEAPVIAATLRSILPQLRPDDRLIVVADNCADATASVASAEGAEVIQRNDPTRKGKGYALDHGIRHLRATPPQVVIMVDADCTVSPDAVEWLVRDCMRTGRPIQAQYLVQPPKDAGIKTQIAGFAQLLKNEVRPLGLHRLGLPCQLQGSGMAFPWSTISAVSLATDHLTEDVKLGIDLARAGAVPRYCPRARVTSPFPVSSEGIQSQRTRWEHGNLSVMLTETPGLLWRALAGRDGRLLVVALDISVPPLALLSLATLALGVASAWLYGLAGVRLPLCLTSAAAVLLAASVLLSWARYGRRSLRLRTLLFAPLYALWKIPLYARFLMARQLEWVRSKRDSDGL